MNHLIHFFFSEADPPINKKEKDWAVARSSW
jgi:hypothetical protein